LISNLQAGPVVAVCIKDDPRYIKDPLKDEIAARATLAISGTVS
jgi:hypothetical protein